MDVSRNGKSGNLKDWTVWLRFLLTVGVMVVGISVAWGALKTDVIMNSWRLNLAEKQIEELRRTNECLVGDVREIKTILTRMENGGKTP